MKPRHVIILALGLSAVSCTNTTSFDVGGRKLRTTGAPFVKLGMTGYKSTAGRNTFYQTENRPEYSPDINVWIATRQHTNITSEAALAGDVTPPAGWKIATVLAKVGRKRSVEGYFDVVACDESMASRLNHPSNRKVRDELMIWGRDARVITLIAISENHKQTKESDLVGEVSGKYKAASGKISYSSNTKQTSRLSDGTVFAYEMSRVAWQTGPDGNPEIAALIPDYMGINRLKRPGTEWDPAKLKSHP
jgi:hypothetical protein